LLPTLVRLEHPVSEGRTAGSDGVEVSSVLKCWEYRTCNKLACPAHGAADVKCWMVSRDFRPGTSVTGDKFVEGCALCGVFLSHVERSVGRRLSDGAVADTVRFLSREMCLYQEALQKA
jgi:hypothetical protein